MIDNKLINLINQKTCDKFSFLRLKQVFFDVNKNYCEISLIYPKSQTLTDIDKQQIIDAIKDVLSLAKAKLVVKINKSFVESDLIKKTIDMCLSKISPVLQSKLKSCDVNVNVLSDDLAIVLFRLERDMIEYFSSFNLGKTLKEFLEKNYCCEFEIKTEERIADITNENFLNDRIENLKAQSDIAALTNMMKDKYVVNDKKVIVGDEITFNPKFIKSVVEPTENGVIAGKISFLTEKSYLSKRTKKNKEGEEERIQKPFFKFSVKDQTGSMNVVIFPSKSNYHKMHLLKDGDNVVVQGKVSKNSYSDKLELMARKINLCSMPEEANHNIKLNADDIVAYKYVKPIKYTSAKQSNLFDSVLNYSKEIQTQSYVVYDFETTGIDPQTDEIIEIGALKIENGRFTDVFTTLVKPKKLIPPDATKINRITNDMVANCYTIEQILRDFYLFCKDCQMVGYNSISFDSQFLINAAKRVGLNFDNGQLDVFMMAKEKLKGLRNYKLGTVAKYLEVNLVDAHRALNDVIATAEVFMKLY